MAEQQGVAETAAPQAPGGTTSSPFKIAGRVFSILLPLAFWFAPLGLDKTVHHALAITLFMIAAWITEAFDHAITGFIGCYLYWVLGVVRFPQAFSGFANDTAWFLFGAILFGMMAMKSGLARRVAYLIMRVVGTSYARILLGMIIVDFVLTFFVPSAISRVVILFALGMGLMEIFGLGKGSNVGRGMFMMLTYLSNIFDKMIIAGASSITSVGLIKSIGKVEVLYSRWTLAFLPCSILTIFIGWRLALWLYPPEVKELPGGDAYFRQEIAKMGHMSVLEMKSALFLALALGLWLTDSLHHMSPSMVGLGVGLLATIPGIGVLDVEDVKKVNYLPIFFVAAALSMGEVLVSTKALDVMTNSMFLWMEPFIHGSFGTTMVLYWTGFFYHFFLASEISMVATSTPLVMKFALAKGMNPLILGMIWTFGSGAKIFVYQSGVMIAGYAYGYFETKDMFKVGLWLSVIESLILLGLVAVYWPMLGYR